MLMREKIKHFLETFVPSSGFEQEVTAMLKWQQEQLDKLEPKTNKVQEIEHQHKQDKTHKRA